MNENATTELDALTRRTKLNEILHQGRATRRHLGLMEA